MTDHTFDQGYRDRTVGRTAAEDRTDLSGPSGGLLRDLYEDFRAVPVEAWIILAVATVMSNLFIALA
ncbi:hypothetical protein [Indioceanicola profundi]|uniref:hypothetical protein n=1 Tax=Indioceanicola profundi TaxID=2220096 RepID=UPI000E6A99C0|nr:hypothetical protein [Indioceanicola profundi]